MYRVCRWRNNKQRYLAPPGKRRKFLPPNKICSNLWSWPKCLVPHALDLHFSASDIRSPTENGRSSPCSAFGFSQNANPEASRRANPRLPTSWSGNHHSPPHLTTGLTKTKYHLPPTSQTFCLLIPTIVILIFFPLSLFFCWFCLAVTSTLLWILGYPNADMGQLQSLLLSDIDVRSGLIAYFILSMTFQLSRTSQKQRSGPGPRFCTFIW